MKICFNKKNLDLIVNLYSPRFQTDSARGAFVFPTCSGL